MTDVTHEDEMAQALAGRAEFDLLGGMAASTASSQEPLTQEKLYEAIAMVMVRDLNPAINESFNPRNPFKYLGIDIHEVPVKMVPIVQVSESFEWLTDEAREHINNKLIELLGYKEQCAIQKNMAYMIGNRVLVRPELSAIMMNFSA